MRQEAPIGPVGVFSGLFVCAHDVNHRAQFGDGFKLLE